jgi:transcription initiation factor IIF auxiliary subunit
VVRARDEKGNTNEKVFYFTLDSTFPEIILNSPANNTVFRDGPDLDFTVTDLNLAGVNYTVNGGANIPLSGPFNISTTGWTDGDYQILIKATDLAGNLNETWYSFTIDTIPPDIQLNSPTNNSIISSGTDLDFSVVDANLMQVNYSVNGGNDISIPSPFDVPTTGWSDGDYTVTVNALDWAGNANSAWFFFTVDSTFPTIILNTPANNSVIPAGTDLNFSVADAHLTQVEYTVNGGGALTLTDPFDISTLGWADGDYTVQINAVDEAGNEKIAWYTFTIDSTKPVIIHDTPGNNSVIQAGTFLNFSVVEPNLDLSFISVNGGADIPFNAPFDLSTTGWADGGYTVNITCTDLAGNTESNYFYFTIDNTEPDIHLNTPSDDSVIPIGTILDFSIEDLNLHSGNYSVDGGGDVPLIDPFDISTVGWYEGEYTIQINAIDIAGNTQTAQFTFTLDSTDPQIQLNSPLNNSFITAGTILDFSVIEDNPFYTYYSINGGTDTQLNFPNDITTTDWADGEYTIVISSEDEAGNLASHWFFFTLDSTPPTIWVDPAYNGTTILLGEIIDILVTDPNLDSVEYSTDGITFDTLTAPYQLDTSTWVGGNYVIQVEAEDTLGNEDSLWFHFTIDTIPPAVISANPINGSTEIAINTTLIITFNEAINETGAVGLLSIGPTTDFTYDWTLSGTVLIISFATDNLEEATTYTLTIDSDVQDLNGLSMGSDYVLVFTTFVPPDFDEDGIPDSIDEDDDNDGYLDTNDTFPFNADEWVDTDNDGTGNNADTDDDDDTHLDTEDYYPLDPTRWKKEDEQESDSSLMLILLIVVIVVILLLVLLMKRRKKPEIPPESTEKEEKKLPPPPPKSAVKEEGKTPADEPKSDEESLEPEAPAEGEEEIGTDEGESGEEEQSPPTEPEAPEESPESGEPEGPGGEELPSTEPEEPTWEEQPAGEPEEPSGDGSSVEEPEEPMEPQEPEKPEWE